jgi:putative toxin-antitoxin system antitoxin component (TIGR02293 family)
LPTGEDGAIIYIGVLKIPKRKFIFGKMRKRDDLIRQVANIAGISIKEARKVVDTVLHSMDHSMVQEPPAGIDVYTQPDVTLSHSEETEEFRMEIPVKSPEALEKLVRQGNALALYRSLQNIGFTYGDLYEYLSESFFEATLQTGKSKATLLSDLMEVSEATFYRWKKSSRTVEEKYAERLTEIIDLFVYGTNVFGSKVEFVRWLDSNNLHLGNQPPIQILDRSSGIRYVRHLLDKIEFGAPV